MTTTAPHTIAFALVRDAEALLDDIDPGDTTLADHRYGPITVRTRRVYSPRQDSLTLIAYQAGQIAATVIAINDGHRVTARIHQIAVAGVLFTRHSTWGFLGRAQVNGQARRFTLTASRTQSWRVEVNGDEPSLWPSLDHVAAHIATAYHPAG